MKLYCLIIVATFGLASLSFSQKQYFYTGKNYGSEASFNPLTFLVNNGFDMVQQQPYTRQIFKIRYADGWKGLVTSLRHPIDIIDAYGRKKFFHNQIFPNKFDKYHLEWVPNYSLHLIGAGTSFTALREWYELNNYPSPYIFSALTVYSSHVLNELIESSENGGYPGVDPIADIYIFDAASILLFSFDWMNSFCSNFLHISDWSYQPSYVFSESSLENIGQCYAMKIELPYLKQWSLFGQFGSGGVFGLSYKINSEESISSGIGLKMIGIRVDQQSGGVYEETANEIGIFFDKNNSLLASVLLNTADEYSCQFNLYPSIITFGNFSPGLWAIINKNGSFSLGFSTQYLIGVGETFHY